MMLAPAKSTALRDMPEPSRVLVITLRRLGDALLTTPLIRTLRRGYPRARLDVLAFRGGEGILAGNPDIDAVITMPERPSPRETAALVAKLWRRYDLVVSTQSGDRPTFYALVAGRYRIGLVPPEGKTGARWKRRAYHVAIAPDARDPPHHPSAAAHRCARPAVRARSRLSARRKEHGLARAHPTRCCMPIRPIATSAGPTRAGAGWRAGSPSAA